MFAKLFKKTNKVRQEGDKVWLSGAQKLRGICQMAQPAADSPELVVVIAHFEQSLQDMAEACESNGIASESLTTIFDQARLKAQIFQPETGRVLLALRAILPLLPDAEQLGMGFSKTPIKVVALERHFLRRYDEQVEAWVKSIPQAASLEFHIALDEPLLHLFGGSAVAQIATSLNLPADEYLPGSAISQSIQQIQKKIAQRVREDAQAYSAEQWLTLNLPEHQSGNGS